MWHEVLAITTAQTEQKPRKKVRGEENMEIYAYLMQNDRVVSTLPVTEELLAALHELIQGASAADRAVADDGIAVKAFVQTLKTIMQRSRSLAEE
jgi:hypothetical protein